MACSPLGEVRSSLFTLAAAALPALSVPAPSGPRAAALLYKQLTAVLHRFSILIASLCERRRAR